MIVTAVQMGANVPEPARWRCLVLQLQMGELSCSGGSLVAVMHGTTSGFVEEKLGPTYKSNPFGFTTTTTTTPAFHQLPSVQDGVEGFGAEATRCVHSGLENHGKS